MKISVLTTYFNRPKHLRLLLASLQAQDRLPDEIVIADDGSDPVSQELLSCHARDCPIPVIIVRQEKDGFRLSAARNIAIRASTGDYLVFLDCDIALLPESIALHEKLAGARRLLCGNRAILGQRETDYLFTRKPFPTLDEWESAWASADKAGVHEAESQFDRHAKLRRWRIARRHKPKLLGCHFSLFREDVFRVNGFDERFVGWGYEDDDFAMRLYKRGVKPFSVIDRVRAMHMWHPSCAPLDLKRHRDRPNRAYFRRWMVPPFCEAGVRYP